MSARYPILRDLATRPYDTGRECREVLTEIDQLRDEVRKLRRLAADDTAAHELERLAMKVDAGYLDDIARTRGEENELLRAREGQLEAQVETLEIVISRLRCICDAAFTFVREDSYTVSAWQALVHALEDARYEPRFDCDGPDCERQGALIVHRPACARWEP